MIKFSSTRDSNREDLKKDSLNGLLPKGFPLFSNTAYIELQIQNHHCTPNISIGYPHIFQLLMK